MFVIITPTGQPALADDRSVTFYGLDRGPVRPQMIGGA